MAITFLDDWSSGTVIFPVPGPISSTQSVGLMAALATIAVTTAGFLRKCWPRDVFGAIRLDDAALGALVDDSLEEWGVLREPRE